MTYPVAEQDYKQLVNVDWQGANPDMVFANVDGGYYDREA